MHFIEFGGLPLASVGKVGKGVYRMWFAAVWIRAANEETYHVSGA